MQKYKYEFKDRNNVIYSTEASTMTEALAKFNDSIHTDPRKPFTVSHEFLFMAVIESPYRWLGVTWQKV